jgi:hypothetical protein
MVMRKRHFKLLHMSKSAIQLYVSGFHIRISTISGRVLQSAHSAAINAKHIPTRLILGIIIAHVKIIVGLITDGKEKMF